MGRRRKRRHPASRGFWTTDHGGMPMWGIVAAGVVIVISAAIALTAINQPERSAAELQQESDRIARETAAENAQMEQERIDKFNAAKAQIVFPADRPYVAQFIGDSITTGSYASSADLYWWRQVAADLGAHGAVETIVNARGGGTAADASAAGVQPADLTVVLLGQNERFKDGGIETFEQTYPALLAEVKAQSPDGELICLSPWFAASYGPEFFRVVRDSCKAAGGEYVEIGTTMIPKNRKQKGEPTSFGVAPDDGHPNDEGHTAIAQRVIGELFYVPPGG